MRAKFLALVTVAAALVAFNLTSARIAVAAGNGVTVAVLDTGIDTTHVAFSGLGAVQWKDFTPTNHATPFDDNGHGTLVSSMIVGSGTTPASLAPGTTLAVGKVLDAGGSSAGDIAAALHWAVDTVHADIINMSLGAYVPGTSVLNADVYDAIAYARSHGALVVVANGNGLLNLATVPDLGWAASYGNAGDALSVGAQDVDGLFVNTDPDVAAVYTVTGAAANTHTGYVTESGTSFGSPYVAGFAARLLAASRAGGHPLNPVGLQTLVEYSARDTILPPTFEGYGVIDETQLPAALAHASNGTLPPAPGQPNAVYMGTLVPLLRTVGRSI